MQKDRLSAPTPAKTSHSVRQRRRHFPLTGLSLPILSPPPLGCTALSGTFATLRLRSLNLSTACLRLLAWIYLANLQARRLFPAGIRSVFLLMARHTRS